MSGFTKQTGYEIIDCATCHVQFAITASMDDRLRANGERFYCPMGHHLSYGKSALDKSKDRARQLERTVGRLTGERDQFEACCTREKQKRWGLMGHVAKLKKGAK